MRGWRFALLGVGVGVSTLTSLALVFGPTLSAIPLTALQLVVGVLLCLFGLSWLREAVLRAAGIMLMQDEADVFARQAATMREASAVGVRRWDAIAVATTFKAVVLEGLEVLFIVLAVGAAGHMMVPASLGAAGAGLAVVIAGLVLHRPLARACRKTP